MSTPIGYWRVEAFDQMLDGCEPPYVIKNGTGATVGFAFNRADADRMAAPAPVVLFNADEVRQQRDDLRRALEIIAVGDATAPQAQAAEELIALGWWRDIPDARQTKAAAPAPVAQPDIGQLMDAADQYAMRFAEAHVERLYGTSDSYTRQCTGNANKLRTELQRAIEGAQAVPAPVAQPLTSDQLDTLHRGKIGLNFVTLREFRIVARAVERAHKIGGAA